MVKSVSRCIHAAAIFGHSRHRVHVGVSTRRLRQEAARGCLICRIGTNIQRPLRIARRTLGKIPRLSQVAYASRLAASEKRVSTWRWRERVHVSLANQLDGTEAFCLQETPCDVPGDLRLTAANHFGCLADRVVVWQNHHRAHTAIVRHVMRIAIGISCRDVLRHKAAVRSFPRTKKPALSRGSWISRPELSREVSPHSLG